MSPRNQTRDFKLFIVHRRYLFSACEEFLELNLEYLRPEFFLLVDLRDFFQIQGRGGGGAKKSSENDQSTGHFLSFFFDWSFSALFSFNISRANSKTTKVNQQSVSNL